MSYLCLVVFVFTSRCVWEGLCLICVGCVLLQTHRGKEKQPTQIRHVPSYKHLEVKTNTTNTNKTCPLLQTPRGKD